MQYSADSDAFDGCPDERYVFFVDESGKELTGTVYENAKAAFTKAAQIDNNPDDGKWWGWSLKEPSAVENTYTVTINAKKDGSDWDSHGRTFALLKDNGGEFLTVQGQPAGNTRLC